MCTENAFFRRTDSRFSEGAEGPLMGSDNIDSLRFLGWISRKEKKPSEVCVCVMDYPIPRPSIMMRKRL